MHKQEVTIYDVARKAKVSMATVSRVVNGNNDCGIFLVAVGSSHQLG